ncbi:MULTISPECIES: YpdA family putative bacillithiol disulfide reductase [unclassified Arcicella]|uniref:YpdA family putative bacillithiol disulfide reductase n=1 Tax=unclassified Arcicella TaxID=2644986 RepID=UPI0028632319|nr:MULTISPECIES: YpdA family putative bacillithiol disulfide reductase [unclassified Arcicella]MDR6560115.1 thioredoxin reductase (NADPH) [Arcicella sp. BE51]MDR6810278.1 thioredoxin reductase (NADPH) [Arcicella sp. BE140]MDR6821628.1 thioredoxin reductase (NADPH) [Arcicella sp. BE139]
MQHYDLVIIGGGPIGLACGLEAQTAGLSYVILEKGCLVNSLYNYPSNMTFFSTSDRLEIGDVPFVSNNAKPTRSEALEYYRRVAIHRKLHIKLFEGVEQIDKSDEKEDIIYTIKTTKSEYQAQHIIIATGFYDIPYLMNVAGEDLPKVTHYYEEPHFYALQNVVVVGANNSAVDAALETWRKGASVTMVIRQDEIGNRVKYWAKPDIENRIKEGSIKAYFNSEVASIRPHEIDIQTPEGIITIENDYVIAMTGYQPNLDFLRKIGITLSNDEILKPTYNDDTQETNLPNIYLAGVICGGMNTHSLFIENSRIHATKILQKITGKVIHNTNY